MKCRESSTPIHRAVCFFIRCWQKLNMATQPRNYNHNQVEAQTHTQNKPDGCGPPCVFRPTPAPGSICHVAMRLAKARSMAFWGATLLVAGANCVKDSAHWTQRALGCRVSGRVGVKRQRVTGRQGSSCGWTKGPRNQTMLEPMFVGICRRIESFQGF